jgi:AcrR family transcriptional regulator
MSSVPLTDRGRRTRTALLLAARRVFEERGYDDTRMSDIARAAQVSHGTVYTYFDSKDEVLREACASFIEDVLAAIRVPDDMRADPSLRLYEGHRRYLEAYSTNARMLEVVEQAARVVPYFRDLVEHLRAVFLERAAGGLRDFQSRGLADPALDPQMVAPALVGMAEAFARRWHELGEQYAVDEVARLLATLWLRAAGVSTAGVSTAGVSTAGAGSTAGAEGARA